VSCGRSRCQSSYLAQSALPAGVDVWFSQGINGKYGTNGNTGKQVSKGLASDSRPRRASRITSPTCAPGRSAPIVRREG
jgi:hypothetical protein